MLRKEKPARASGTAKSQVALVVQETVAYLGCWPSGKQDQRLEPNRSLHNTHCFVCSHPGLLCPFCRHMVDVPAIIFGE